MDFTVDQLIYEHKIVLDSLLIDLSKIRLGNQDEPVAELEHQGGVGVTPSSVCQPAHKALRNNALCHHNDIQVVDPDVKETGRPKRDDWRSHVAIRDNLYPEHVCDRPPTE
jgi:hypothetical protein